MPRTPTLPYALALAILSVAEPLSAQDAAPANAAPANDDPGGAITVNTRRNMSRFRAVNTADATRSAALPCTGANDDDVFFDFVAAGTGLRLEYRDLSAPAPDAGVGYAVYDAADDRLLGCDYRVARGTAGDGFLDLATALVPGRAYRLALFTGAAGGGRFSFRLSSHDMPRIVANPGDDCVSATVTLDGTGGRVDALTPGGEVLASLSNREALGRTTVTVRGHRGPAPREAEGRPFYDRNVTIVPGAQPSTPVDVDLYVTAAEMLRLARAGDFGRAFASYGVVATAGTSCSPTYAGGGEALPLQRVLDYPGGYRVSLTVNSLSEYFLRPEAAPLPVELVAFEAEAVGAVNRARWRVYDEDELAAYRLERAGAPEAAARWESVAEVAPRGTAPGEGLDYEATDAAPLQISYYRLRQIDRDGTEALSDVVAVERSATTPLQLYPNPVQAGTPVTVSLPAEYRSGLVDVIDATGRRVSRTTVGEREHLTLDTGDFAAGVYTLAVRMGELVETTRLVIR